MRLSLGIDCDASAECARIAEGLHSTLTRGSYAWPASILELSDHGDYLSTHRTARRRRARALRLGYTSRPIDRSEHPDEIFEINTSTSERQGRPMAPAYMERQEFRPLPAYTCRRHAIRSHGVFTPDELLVAYIVLYTCGDIALVSQILGHADHLASDVMYLLTVDALTDTLERSGPVVVFYNRHDSGTGGLRFFKERLGFRPERVEWAP